MQRYPTDDRSDRQDSQQKNPKFQFRGTWTPAGIMHAMIVGRLSGREMSLLSIVEAFVTPHGDGCYATNAYLARSLNVSRRSIPRMIAKLRELGLVRTEYRDGVRYLETSWSRAGELPDQCTNAPMTSTSWGDDVDVTQKNTPTEYSESKKKKKYPPGTPPSAAPPPQPPPIGQVVSSSRTLTPSVASPAPGRQSRPRIRKAHIPAPSAAPPPPRARKEESAVTAPFVCTNPAPVCRHVGRDMAYAERYKALAAKRGWHPPLNMPQWAGAFGTLRLRLKAAGREGELERVLTWYEKASANGDSPVMTTPFHFSRNFDWLVAVSKKADSTADDEIVISPEAEEIAGRASDDYAEWIHSLLPKWVQKSLDNFRPVWKRLGIEAAGGREISPLAKRLLGDLLSPEEFVTDWFRRKASYVEYLSGKLRIEAKPEKVVFHVAHPDWDAIGSRAAEEWGGVEEDWKQLKARVET